MRREKERDSGVLGSRLTIEKLSRVNREAYARTPGIVTASKENDRGIQPLWLILITSYDFLEPQHYDPRIGSLYGQRNV